MLGKTVDHYRVLEEIGRGSFGIVYKAEDTTLPRFVALKFPSDQISADRAALDRFRREAGAASSLNHRNICVIHGVGEFDEKPFIVMEFLEGQTLKQLIGGKPLPLDRAIDFGIQIADGLAAAHQKPIVHRDIKPGNIFVKEDDQIRILDFGLAKVTPLTTSKGSSTQFPSPMDTGTGSYSIMGTLNYMSPEQIRGEALDTRSDLFSFGAVLYEMCTGTLAFTGIGGAAYESILSGAPITPTRLNPLLHPKLAYIISKALEKDRTVRYQHASVISADLKRFKRDSENVFPAREPVPVPRPRSKSSTLRVAVLPLQNKTGNPESEVLAEGIPESLISSLAQVPTLTVISRMSSFNYRGAAVDASTVGRELNVGAILVGLMVSRGDSLTVSLELINTADKSYMWGHRYTRKLEDLVTLEEEIADDVATQLESKFKKTTTRRPTQNSEALRLYMEGRFYWNKRTTEAIQKGLDCFNRAIEHDPAYALAYTGVADSYNMLVWNIALSSHDGFPKARMAAQKALEIDGRLGEAHLSLAFVRLFYEWDWQGAETEFQRTFALNPSYSIARQWYAVELSALGRHDDAIRETEHALQLDPRSNSINATSALAFYFKRQFEPALAQSLKTIELDPNFFAAHFVCGLNYEQVGRYEEAIAEFHAAVDLSGRLPLFLSALGHGYAVAGKREEAQRMIDEIRDASKQKYRSSYAVAAIYAGLGDTEHALEWLEKACDERATWMIFLRVHPYFDGLDRDPRFQEVVKRLQLPS